MSAYRLYFKLSELCNCKLYLLDFSFLEIALIQKVEVIISDIYYRLYLEKSTQVISDDIWIGHTELIMKTITFPRDNIT